MSKLWHALLHLNFTREDIKKNLNDILLVPLNIGVYSIGFKLLIKALSPALFSNEKCVVYNDSNYKRKYVLFDRFKFDVCSLIAKHIDNESIYVDSFEIILRYVYKSITFFRTPDQVMIRKFKDVS